MLHPNETENLVSGSRCNYKSTTVSRRRTSAQLVNEMNDVKGRWNWKTERGGKEALKLITVDCLFPQFLVTTNYRHARKGEG